MPPFLPPIVPAVLSTPTKSGLLSGEAANSHFGVEEPLVSPSQRFATNASASFVAASPSSNGVSSQLAISKRASMCLLMAVGYPRRQVGNRRAEQDGLSRL